MGESHRSPRVRRLFSILKSTTSGYISLKALNTVIEKLVELRDILPSDQSEISELIKSTEAAREHQTEAVSKQAVKETDAALERIKRKVSLTDEIGKRCHSIIDTIRGVLAILKDIDLPF